MFSSFIFTSNNFWKPCLKRESSSTLLTQSKTHIQAHLSQAPASLDREERVKLTRSSTQPQIAPPHLTPDRIGLIAPQHRRDRTQPLARSNQPLARLRRLKHRRDRIAWSTNEIAPMTHSCPISLFLNIPFPFPQLSITLVLPLSPFDRIFSSMNVLFWFLFHLSLYIEIFYYEICLETEKMVEKMWKTSRKITFS